MINIDDAQYIRNPYPRLFLDNCLPELEFKKLSEEFPSAEESLGFKKVMGNRRRLASDQLEFYSFLKHNPSWNEFYHNINSQAFVGKVLEKWAKDIEEFGSMKYKRALKFFPNEYKTQAKIRKVFGDSWLSSKIIRFRKKLISVFYRNYHPVYIHFDISSAYDGYWREAHRDSDNRICAFLVYFSDSEETGGIGGEFVIHQPKINQKDFVFPRQPDETQLEVYEKIEPKKNRFIMFLSTPNSYHSVPLINGSKATRKFIYVGITSNFDKVWKY